MHFHCIHSLFSKKFFFSAYHCSPCPPLPPLPTHSVADLNDFQIFFFFFQGGIYEHGDAIDIPAKKLKSPMALPFTPRAVRLKQPKTAQPVLKSKGAKPERESKGRPTNLPVPYVTKPVLAKFHDAYQLRSHSDLDQVLCQLDAWPPLPAEEPKWLPNQDIRDAQDLVAPRCLWRGERPSLLADDSVYHADKWVWNDAFPIREGQELAILSHRYATRGMEQG